MVPANVSVFMADKTSEMASASIYVLRGNFSCLLLLQEALQDQQMGMTQAPFKLLPLPWVLEHVILHAFCHSGISLFNSLLALIYTHPHWPSKSAIQGAYLCVGPLSWGAKCGIWTPHFLEKTHTILIILLFLSYLLRVWVLTILHLHCFYQSCGSSFFVFLIVKNLFC